VYILGRFFCFPRDFSEESQGARTDHSSVAKKAW